MMLQKGNYILNRKKIIVQTKIRGQMNIYEMKITNDIRQCKLTTRPEAMKKIGTI